MTYPVSWTKFLANVKQNKLKKNQKTEQKNKNLNL